MSDKNLHPLKILSRRQTFLCATVVQNIFCKRLLRYCQPTFLASKQKFSLKKLEKFY
jgi:hypothetical protein